MIETPTDSASPTSPTLSESEDQQDEITNRRKQREAQREQIIRDMEQAAADRQARREARRAERQAQIDLWREQRHERQEARRQQHEAARQAIREQISEAVEKVPEPAVSRPFWKSIEAAAQEQESQQVKEPFTPAEEESPVPAEQVTSTDAASPTPLMAVAPAAGPSGHRYENNSGGQEMAGPFRAAGSTPTPSPQRSAASATTQQKSATTTTNAYPLITSTTSRPSWARGVAPIADSLEEVAHAATVAKQSAMAPAVASMRISFGKWSDLPQAAAAAPRGAKHTVLSLPALPDSHGSLTACGKGEYRKMWESFAQALQKAQIDNPILDISAPTKEMNPQAYASCYRQVAEAVKGVLPRATMQWTVTRGTDGPYDAVAAWPGDGVVDIVALDALDTGGNWSKAVNGDRGLNWWVTFAQRRGAKIAVSAWGPGPGSDVSSNNAPYVQNMHDWLWRVAQKNALVYDLYTEGSKAAGGRAAQAYRALFR